MFIKHLHFGHIRIVCGTELYVVVKTSTKENKHKKIQHTNVVRTRLIIVLSELFLYCVFMF